MAHSEQDTLVFKASTVYKCLFLKKKSTEKADKTLKAIQSEMEWVNSANFNILKFFCNNESYISRILINTNIWISFPGLLMVVLDMMQYYWDGESLCIDKVMRFHWISVCSLGHHTMRVLLH